MTRRCSRARSATSASTTRRSALARSTAARSSRLAMRRMRAPSGRAPCAGRRRSARREVKRCASPEGSVQRRPPVVAAEVGARAARARGAPVVAAAREIDGTTVRWVQPWTPAHVGAAISACRRLGGCLYSTRNVFCTQNVFSTTYPLVEAGGVTRNRESTRGPLPILSNRHFLHRIASDATTEVTTRIYYW